MFSFIRHTTTYNRAISDCCEIKGRVIRRVKRNTALKGHVELGIFRNSRIENSEKRSLAAISECGRVLIRRYN